MRNLLGFGLMSELVSLGRRPVFGRGWCPPIDVVVAGRTQNLDARFVVGEQFDDMSPKDRVSDSFEPVWLELRP